MTVLPARAELETLKCRTNLRGVAADRPSCFFNVSPVSVTCRLGLAPSSPHGWAELFEIGCVSNQMPLAEFTLESKRLVGLA